MLFISHRLSNQGKIQRKVGSKPCSRTLVPEAVLYAVRLQISSRNRSTFPTSSGYFPTRETASYVSQGLDHHPIHIAPGPDNYSCSWWAHVSDSGLTSGLTPGQGPALLSKFIWVCELFFV